MMVGLAKPRPTLQSQNNGDPVMTNRREFLKLSSLVGLGITVPTFLARTAFAAPDAAKPGAKDTILVVVQFTGGNDGLNTVVPFKDELYAKYRPTIKLPTRSTTSRPRRGYAARSRPDPASLSSSAT